MKPVRVFPPSDYASGVHRGIYGFGAAAIHYILPRVSDRERRPGGTVPAAWIRIGRLIMMRKGGVFVLALAAVLAMAPQFASAQAPALSFRSRSFINPFPQTDRYNLYVFGDGLADGLARGLEQAFRTDGTLRVINAAHVSTSLARRINRDWGRYIDEITTRPMHIAVVMLGTNDLRNIRTNSGYARWGADAWRKAYAGAIDTLIKALKDRGVAVYWVGLPVMSKQKTSEAMSVLNDIFRERTYIGNVKFIDSWNGFTDQSGGFTAYGPDLSGQTRRLREPDGMSFTARGNRKLANYVEVLVRRDLAEARAERNIPLAGDEDEQARLVRKQGATKEKKDAKDTENDAKSAVPSWEAEVKKDGSPAAGAGGKKLPRPEPQKAASTEPVARRQPARASFRAGDTPPGQTIMGDLSDDVTSLATVSPMADLNAAIDAGERRLPLAKRLYYRVLVKGEALKPKPGRADDFKWPRG